MPIEIREIPDTISKPSSISLRDLLGIVFNEIRDYATERQGIMEAQRLSVYVKDLVTEPACRLSKRKDLAIHHSLSEALAIHVAFRMMADERIIRYVKNGAGPAMRLEDNIPQERIDMLLEASEEKMKTNEWLYKMVNRYLEQEAPRKQNQ